MSIYYHYPNTNFLKTLNRTFHSDFTTCDHISDIWDELIDRGVPENELAQFLITKGNLSLDCATSSKEAIIDALEYTCRKGNKKCLGPGAMSNFPDRFDGFHSYNRCCRGSQDKGRSKANLKSYTKDRRAYEYWSDGNIHAANLFMHSAFFDGTSADHIGPISLGFVHDSHYLQPMSSGDNSAKRDRLQISDIERIIQTEERTGVYPMSWQSRLIWEYIRAHYQQSPEKVPAIYRNALKQNMSNFMFVLYTILQTCPFHGESFLITAFLKPHCKYFEYTYQFNKLGDIIDQKPRHYTERNKNETDRYSRIAIDAVWNYHNKDNRQTKPDITASESQILQQICTSIENATDFTKCKSDLMSLIESIQRRIISTL